MKRNTSIFILYLVCGFFLLSGCHMSMNRASNGKPEKQLNAEKWLKHGNTCYKKGDLNQAIANYGKALEIDPQNAIAYYNRGNAWHKKGEMNRAVADYSNALEINPKLAMAYYNRGNAWYTGALEQAISDYSKFLDVNPNDADAYVNRGNAYYKKNDFDRAIADYSRAIEIDPENAESYYNRGNAWHKKSKLKKALADVEKAFRLKPGNAMFQRSMAYFENNIQKSSGTGIGEISSRLSVTATALNIRSGPSVENEIVGLLKKGLRVWVLEESRGWARIGKGQWVSAKYLNWSTQESMANITYAPRVFYYSLHVASFRNIANVKKQAHLLAGKGQYTWWKKINISGKGEWYRLYIGRGNNRLEVRSLGAKLKSQGIINYFNVQEIAETDELENV